MHSHHGFIIRAAVIAGLAAGALAGCGSQATVRGKISDEGGTQQQALIGTARQGLSSTPDGLGGQGSASAASEVKLSTLGANGALSVVATAKVNADGTYSLDAPPGQEKLVVQAVDASGNVVSSAIIDATGSAGATVTAPPMDTETSVEAQVLVQMVAQGTAVADANAIDLRARINTDVAAAVKATATSGGNAQAEITGLAQAVIAAQKTQVKALAQAGVQTSQSALFEAQLSAAQKLDVALDTGGSAAANAYADFFTGLQAAAKSAGASAKQQAQAESSADASFRATVDVRLQTSGGAPDPVADAAVRQATVLEAHASSAAVDAILQAGSAGTSLQANATTQENSLETQLSTAASAAAAASAVATFKTSFTGGADVTTGVVGAYLGVNATNELAVQTAVSATATAAAALSTALNAAVSASVQATGSVDFDALANAVVSAYATYDTAVQAQATALAAFGANAQPAVDLLVVTQGSFQLGQ